MSQSEEKRVWPLVVVGGGPAAALQLHRPRSDGSDALVVAKDFGGGMGFLGNTRLQSYTEELSIGLPMDGLRAQVGTGLQPTGAGYTSYVASAIETSGQALKRGTVVDITRDRGELALGVSADGAVTEVRAHTVVLATGTQARRPPPAMSDAGAHCYDEVVADLLSDRVLRYQKRSALVVGSGNSALQTAALLSSVASDVTILAKRYMGVYPQETEDRFAWRAPSQLTCELVAKSALRCRATPRFVPCIRLLIYDDLSVGSDGAIRFTYREEANANVLGQASLPPRCPHVTGRCRMLRPGTWIETRSAGTVVVWATGVEPVYPGGRLMHALSRGSDGIIPTDPFGETAVSGLFLSGACAGYRSVNEMKPALPDLRRGPVVFQLSSVQANGATRWIAGFDVR